MPPISDAIRLFAEEPEVFVAVPPPPARRIAQPAFSLLLSPTPTQSAVSSIHTTEADLDATIAEVRAIVKDAGYHRVIWAVGPSCRPANLAALLAARGFVPATRPPFEPEVTAMALCEPPPAEKVDAEARRVRDFDEYILALRIAMEAFGETEEAAAGWLAAAPGLWAQSDGNAGLTHLAFVDGRPVGFAFVAQAAHGLLLGGSGVLPSARGRGAYRALVAARWALAVEMGRPALVIQAGAMARPIVERCGFQVVCRVDNLDDPTVWPPGDH